MPKFILLLLITLMSCGCSLHIVRPVELPETMPDNFSAENHNSDLNLHRWWENFNDPQLNTLMETAFSDNLDIQQAISRLRQAHILYQQSGSGLLPWLNLDASAGRQKTQTSIFNYTENTYSLSLTAGYEIDLWRKIASQKNAADFRKKASYEDIKSLHISLSSQIAEAWYRRQELALRLQLLDEITAFYTDRLHQVEKQYGFGLTDAEQLYQARQALDQAAARRPPVKATLLETENTLALLAGSWPGSPLPDTLMQLPDIAESFPLGLPSDLIKQRPDVRAAFSRLQAVDADIAAAVADRFPQVQLAAGYGRQGNELSHIFDPQYSFWKLISSLSQPLFDAGRRRQEVDYRKEIYQEQLLACQSSLMHAFRDVMDALNAERAADISISLQKRRLENSSKNAELSRTKYEKGIASYLDMLDQNIQHSENSIAVLASDLQRLTARIGLARALGGNWMDDAINQHLNQPAFSSGKGVKNGMGFVQK